MGGGPFENKILFDQGIPCRDHVILTKAILVWGGALWKIKFPLTRADPCLTKELAPRYIHVGGGPCGQIVKHMVTMGVLLDNELNTETPCESFWTNS